MLICLVLGKEKLKALGTSSNLYLFFVINLPHTRDEEKKTLFTLCGPWFEVEKVTKPGKSSVVFG